MTDQEYETTYDKHFRLVMYFNFRFGVRDPHLSEDMAQECLLRLWCQRKRVRSADVKSWLYVVGRNLLIDRKRRHRLIQVELNGAANVGDMASSNEFTAVDYRLDLRPALERLPPMYRRMIESRYFEDLSYRHMADHYGVPLGTVKSRLGYAKFRLRSLLAS